MARQRSEIVLAAIAAGGPEARYDPVRAQKLFFLIDREIPEFIGGPYFRFEPHHYGPFDEAVYEELDRLTERQKVSIDTDEGYNRYSLTDTGYAKGTAVLDVLPDPTSSYMENTAKWVRFVPLKQLLSTIYRQYPEMAVNSIIPQVASGYSHASFRFAMPSFLSGIARTLDFMGTLDGYQLRTSDERLDALAVYHDWSAVGDDLGAAMSAQLIQGTPREPQT